jgi:hypothetical protein
MAEPSATPLRLQSLLIRGGRAPDVHVSLVAGGAHDPSPAMSTVYFGTPSMFITLWFGFDYGTNLPQEEGKGETVVTTPDRLDWFNVFN